MTREIGQRVGVLLLNVGTPDEPSTSSVRRYLREFLSDPRVVDLPAPMRWLLLNVFILPFRPAKSAAAYRKIWTEQGSPLAVNSRALRDGLQVALGDGYWVETAMRYGNPRLSEALEQFVSEGVTELVVVPVYPQYAASSTGTSLAAVYEQLSKRWNIPAVRVIPPFYDLPGFLHAFEAVAKPVLQSARPDHLLVSFHGLPERHIRKSDLIGTHCLQSEDCCDVVVPANRFCYRAQSFQTARALAHRLGFDAEHFSVSFQSRLGRTPWIQPFTDLVIPELAKKGVRRLAVLCPSFVADCLETLEEIGIRASESFIAAGGEKLTLVPSLNGHPIWVHALAEQIAPSAASR
jgi:ferrochelatase